MMDAKPSWGDGDLAIPHEQVRSVAQRAIDVALISQKQDGEIGGIGWWQSANAYTAIALHDIYSGSKQNYKTLAAALKKCEGRHSDFSQNEYNDDVLWWGICCVHVYNINRDHWFLEKAKQIWRRVEDGYVCGRGQASFNGNDMEGACYWTTKHGEQQVNAITSGLFAELSLRLAALGQEPEEKTHSWKKLFKKAPATAGEYIRTARCSLEWILHCRYRAEDCIVLDHILLREQKAEDWTFTYTTGVTIGVCALLFRATSESQYLTFASNMAQKAMRRSSWVEENGVLTESGAYGKDNKEPNQNDDAVGFKAVLIRHLATLYNTIVECDTPTPEAAAVLPLIKTFVNINFQSQQDRNTNGQGQYGPWWNGPFDMPTSHSQMAVLDVMAAALLVTSR